MVCVTVAGMPALEVVERADEDLEELAPSAGAGGGRPTSGALIFPYKVNKTLGASAALFFAAERLPPQNWVLLPGHAMLQLPRFETALVPASRVSAQ